MGEYLEALATFESLRPTVHDPEERTWLYILASRAAAGRNQLKQTLAWAGHAVEIAESSGSAELTARSLHNFGRFSLRVQETRLAIETFLRVLIHLQQCPEMESLQADVYFNLGYAYRLARDLEMAMLHYGLAISMARKFAYQDCLLASLHNLAWLMCLRGQASEAEEHVTEAGQLVLAGSEDDRAMHLCLRALYHLRLGDVARAANLAAEAIDPERPDCLPVRGQAYWLMAECALLTNGPTAARSLVQHGQRWAHKAGDVTTLNLLSDLLTRIGGTEEKTS